MSATPDITEPFSIGGVRLDNRIALAPLAGIGNWFVRLQARRHGAGLAFSEMLSSFAIQRRNPRTVGEMLRIHPGEHPLAIQLFGPDPEAMHSAAGTVANAGADLIDINMGCPVPKICRSGAGAALLDDPDRAVAVARAVAEGGGVPVTVKLRSGISPGDESGLRLAVRLVEEAGVSAISLHPRHASQRHRGRPDYALVRRLVGELDVPVIVSGGLTSAAAVRRAYEESGAAAVMIARGALGNPWIFAELTAARSAPPSAEEIVTELLWTIDCAEEHMGTERACRYLRKFHPWYMERLGVPGRVADRLQRLDDLSEVRRLVGEPQRLLGKEPVDLPPPSPALAAA